MHIEIRKLEQFSTDDANNLGPGGYIADSKFSVVEKEFDGKTIIIIEKISIDRPYKKKWNINIEDINRYEEIIPHGLSFGAYIEDNLVGVIITEKIEWNNTLRVWEIQVSEKEQGKGIGTRLMMQVIQQAKKLGFRLVVLETQNTNTPAISFYKSLGFKIEGIDLSYYTNSDLEDGEVAIFMKKKLK